MKSGFPADYQQLFEQLQTDRYLNEYVKYAMHDEIQNAGRLELSDNPWPLL